MAIGEWTMVHLYLCFGCQPIAVRSGQQHERIIRSTINYYKLELNCHCRMGNEHIADTSFYARIMSIRVSDLRIRSTWIILPALCIRTRAFYLFIVFTSITITDLLHRWPWAVVNQYYGADILMEYVIKGNSAVLKCAIPSFVADFVKVESWVDEAGVEILPSDNYG